MKQGIDNDTAVSCLNLADRIWDKYLGAGVSKSGRMGPAPQRRRGKMHCYHKGNPIPPGVKGWVIARLKAGDFYGEIARLSGVSLVAICRIAQGAGLARGQGRRTRGPGGGHKMAA